MTDQADAEERKRKRLEAWRRKRQQQEQQPASGSPATSEPVPLTKVSLSLGKIPKRSEVKKKKPKKKRPVASNIFADDPDESTGGQPGNDASLDEQEPTLKRPLITDFSEDIPKEDNQQRQAKKKQKTGRWDKKEEGSSATSSSAPAGGNEPDALDQFMNKLHTQFGQVKTTVGSADDLSIQVSGSMASQTQRSPKFSAVSGGVITADQLESLGASSKSKSSSNKGKISDSDNLTGEAKYSPKDWMSDVPSSDTEDEQNEEEARRALIEALKSASVPSSQANEEEKEVGLSRPAQLASEVRSEKSRREFRMKELERQAEEARMSAEAAAAPELGRLFMDDTDGGVMEEAERDLEAAKAAPDALTVLAELNKKKELKAVDHSQIDYIPFQKNLYRVPRELSELSNEEVVSRRAKLKVRVRGHGAPAPVSSFEQCGLSEKILKILSQQGIEEPFPVQAQSIPCIMGKKIPEYMLVPLHVKSLSNLSLFALSLR